MSKRDEKKYADAQTIEQRLLIIGQLPLLKASEFSPLPILLEAKTVLELKEMIEEVIGDDDDDRPVLLASSRKALLTFFGHFCRSCDGSMVCVVVLDECDVPLHTFVEDLG